MIRVVRCSCWRSLVKLVSGLAFSLPLCLFPLCIVGSGVWVSLALFVIRRTSVLGEPKTVQKCPYFFTMFITGFDDRDWQVTCGKLSNLFLSGHAQWDFSKIFAIAQKRWPAAC